MEKKIPDYFVSSDAVFLIEKIMPLLYGQNCAVVKEALNRIIEILDYKSNVVCSEQNAHE